MFVQGLNDPESAPLVILSALYDFCFLCSCFACVKVIKVSRLVVQAAHDMARAAVPRL